MITIAVLVALVVIAVAVIVFALRRFDRPAEVPDDFVVPTQLPVGPGLAPDTFAFDSDRTGNFEIFLAELPGGDTDGEGEASNTTGDDRPDGGAVQLTDDPAFDSWWPRISPDRTTILFYRAPKGVHDLDATKVGLWAMGADGSDPVLLRPAGLDGWTMQGHAEWHPDGSALVMFGGSRFSPQVFVTDPTGANPRQLTDRGGRNLDPAYSADGRRVWFVGCPKSVCSDADQEIYSVELDDTGTAPAGDPVRHTTDDIRDNDPYESPDGTRLGWLSQVETGGIGVWDVRMASLDEAGRFSSEPRRLVDDSAVTSRPQWSVDGATIVTHRLEPGRDSFDLVVIDAETGAVTALPVNSDANDEYPSL